jgi:hypothetical protein
LKPREHKPALRISEGSDLPLSGTALAELMRAVLSKGVPFRFRAKGWSMSPFLRDGDVITISPLGGAVPGVGEVVAFVHREANKPVVHRIIARRGADCLIRGDNLPGAGDGLVPRGNILGRVARVDRDGRKVWLGLGPERFLIAFLSRVGLLFPARERLMTLIRPFLKRSR